MWKLFTIQIDEDDTKNPKPLSLSKGSLQVTVPYPYSTVPRDPLWVPYLETVSARLSSGTAVYKNVFITSKFSYKLYNYYSQ